MKMSTGSWETESILSFQRKLSCATRVDMMYQCMEDQQWSIAKTYVYYSLYIILLMLKCHWWPFFERLFYQKQLCFSSAAFVCFLIEFIIIYLQIMLIVLFVENFEQIRVLIYLVFCSLFHCIAWFLDPKFIRQTCKEWMLFFPLILYSLVQGFS